MITKQAIFDTHFHLYEKDNPQQIISAANKENILFLMNIGVDLDSSKKAQKIANTFPNVYCSAGVHPCNTDNFNGNIEPFKKILADPNCRTVGEIGLDYFHPHNKEKQKKTFANFLDLAYKLKKPAVIHCRDAFFDCIQILEKHLKKEQPFILHCYTGDSQWAKKIIELGGYISYSGILTFNKTDDLKESLKSIPQDKILLETDAPYLTPVPYRGKRNQPAYIIHTLEKMAEILNLSIDKTAQLTRQNACRLLGITDVI